MDMPDNYDNMTIKEVKDWVAKEQQAIDLKREVTQKLCWDEIGEVCKKHSCMIKPVVKLRETEDGFYSHYADLVVISVEETTDEQSDEKPSGDRDKSDDKESNEAPDDARKEQGHESSSSENDKA